jgi:hypothetical protein
MVILRWRGMRMHAAPGACQNYFCMKPTQRFSAASPAGDDHQA